MKKPDRPRKSYIEDQAAYAPALESPALELGLAEENAPRRPRPVKSALAWNLNEYLTGPLFLLVSHAYTYLVPDRISSVAGVKEVVQLFLKRTIDIVFSAIGLLLATPLFIILPILIKLDSPGPVFYAQVRVGQNRRKGNRRAYSLATERDRRRRERRREELMGRPFKVYKFRTMIADAEKATGPVWATANDPRITRLGRFLRKSRLDEVPQLICVLKGEMSLVGPRPERPVFVKQLSEQVPNYHRRLSVRPGITGLAQIENGYDSCVNSVAEKIQMDLRYIDNWSVLADIKILFRTVWVVLTGKGAH